MIDSELLRILVCPETKQPVEEADSGLVARVNRLIEAGSLRNRAGELVNEPIEAGLVRSDGKVLYPVREGIPVMLLDEAIPLESLA